MIHTTKFNIHIGHERFIDAEELQSRPELQRRLVKNHVLVQSIFLSFAFPHEDPAAHHTPRKNHLDVNDWNWPMNAQNRVQQPDRSAWRTQRLRTRNLFSIRRHTLERTSSARSFRVFYSNKRHVRLSRSSISVLPETHVYETKKKNTPYARLLFSSLLSSTCL